MLADVWAEKVMVNGDTEESTHLLPPEEIKCVMVLRAGTGGVNRDHDDKKNANLFLFGRVVQSYALTLRWSVPGGPIKLIRRDMKLLTGWYKHPSVEYAAEVIKNKRYVMLKHSMYCGAS